MQFLLPISELSVTIRDFVPHRVAVAFNDAAYKALNVDQSVIGRQVTKDELLSEFGVEAIRKLDELPPGEYEKELSRLREQYVGSRIKAVDITCIQKANMVKVTGMVTGMTEEQILDLPHEDVLFILEKIEEVWNNQRKKKSNAQPKSL